MDEKALVVYLAQIMGNQYAIMDLMATAFSNQDKEKKDEIYSHVISQGQQYSKILQPVLLKGANLDWDVNDLLKP